jgi:hypothetical protein
MICDSMMDFAYSSLMCELGMVGLLDMSLSKYLPSYERLTAPEFMV